jgi:predicted nucleic acid-binding Zn ribbon protein
VSKDPYDPVPIGKVLDDHTRRYGMGAAQEVGALFSSWPRIVGPAVAEHVEPVSLRDGVLKLVADSPTWATEINYLKEKIRTQANEALGGGVVSKVEVSAGRGRGRQSDLGRTEEASPEPGPKRPDAPRADDPMTAFERARAAWLRRRSRDR